MIKINIKNNRKKIFRSCLLLLILTLGSLFVLNVNDLAKKTSAKAEIDADVLAAKEGDTCEADVGQGPTFSSMAVDGGWYAGYGASINITSCKSGDSPMEPPSNPVCAEFNNFDGGTYTASESCRAGTAGLIMNYSSDPEGVQLAMWCLYDGRFCNNPKAQAAKAAANDASAGDQVCLLWEGSGQNFATLSPKPGAADCDAALAHIKTLPRGTWDTHLAKLIAGTYTWTVGGTTYEVDGPQAYPMLQRDVYMANGGEPKCDTPPDTPGTCPPPSGTKSVSTCEGDGASLFSDDQRREAWLDCGKAYNEGVDHSSENTGHAIANPTHSNVTKVGHEEYCKIFCMEVVETDFPYLIQSPVGGIVNAGQTFYWGIESRGSDVFGTINSRKECRTRDRNNPTSEDGYLYERWWLRYKKNQTEFVGDWMAIVVTKIFNSDDNVDVSPPTSCCPSDDDSCADGCCGEEGTEYTATRGAISRSYDRDDVVDSFTVGPSYDFEVGGSEGYTRSDLVTTIAEKEATECDEDADTAKERAIEESMRDVPTDTRSDKNAEEIKLLMHIRQCVQDMKYEYKTVVHLFFKEPENSAYGENSRVADGELDPGVWTLNPSGDDSSLTNNKVLTNGCDIQDIVSHECTSEEDPYCDTYEETEVWDCEEGYAAWEIDYTATYSYPTNTFTWFSVKTNNKLRNQAKATAADKYRYPIGGVNFPTAFSLTDGRYTMAVTVTNLGDAAINEAPANTAPAGYQVSSGHFGPMADDIPGTVDTGGNDVVAPTAGGKGFVYTCEYEVDNEIFGFDCQYTGSTLTSGSPIHCDTSKDGGSSGMLTEIDVVYRLVALMNDGSPLQQARAFPGRDGNGRYAGRGWNWRILNDAIVLDVLRSSRRQEDPMYEIYLDIPTIRAIRLDNQSYLNIGVDPYGSFCRDIGGGCNDEKIVCTGNTTDGVYCASRFLTNLAGNGVNNTSSRGTVVTPTRTFQTRHTLRGTCIEDWSTSTSGRASSARLCGHGNAYTRYDNTRWRRE